MTLKDRLVAALLWIYPVSWRREYGSELADIVEGRLTAGVVADVIWNGVKQRVRMVEPSTVIGLALMLILVAGFVENVVAHGPLGKAFGTPFSPTGKTLPTVRAQPISNEVYLLMMLACGWWSERRRGTTLFAPGGAAIRAALISHIPIVLAGLLVWVGDMGVVVVGPGDVTTTFDEHRFTYTFYNESGFVPSAMSLVTAPLFRLPESWLWGMIGGRLRQWYARSRRMQIAGC